MEYPPSLERAVVNYDPDIDIEKTGGSEGIRLADAILRYRHRNLESLGLDLERLRDSHKNLESLGLDWRKIAKIALPRFPELQQRERISRREVKRRLSDLKDAGFPVKPDYGKMPVKHMLNYFLHLIRPDVYRMAKDHCPETLREINQKNDQAKESARL